MQKRECINFDTPSLVSYISAWASALLVQTVMGNARASECGTGDEFDSHAFSYTINNHSTMGVVEIKQLLWTSGLHFRH